ncbi:uncharacterized protein YbbK (DUF523 family) [Aneurinibacillus soli]|uniref:Uncharacterized protein n=1 Tax=Aneurinibacillus soli TaxID=1500254 RepID=A0A0U5B0N8_9BACL|nr:DUF523 domain-containing protein [Aneurinibacillus soli]PYE59133.1 uncharacterized protein YbbK (DUF523 family) [Aneurinibacillus soli]BAU29553.1 hypothetical protein CB4_03753 [Aneurinibacillus soli]
MKIISACLLGCECRYDGRHNRVEKIEEWLRKGEAIPVCPEQLGGLSTPRLPAEIVGGDGFDVLDGHARVIDNEGNDVTKEFIHGAEQTLRIAQTAKASAAILKERSPSCGSTLIYNGTFSKEKRSGPGVTAALLTRHGISVSSEETT